MRKFDIMVCLFCRITSPSRAFLRGVLVAAAAVMKMAGILEMTAREGWLGRVMAAVHTRLPEIKSLSKKYWMKTQTSQSR